MNIVDGHKIIRTQPINPDLLPPDFPRIMLQDAAVYTPPTCINRRVGIAEYFDIKQDMSNLACEPKLCVDFGDGLPEPVPVINGASDGLK